MVHWGPTPARHGRPSAQVTGSTNWKFSFNLAKPEPQTRHESMLWTCAASLGAASITTPRDSRDFVHTVRNLDAVQELREGPDL